jgi:hypothetical protein
MQAYDSNEEIEKIVEKMSEEDKEKLVKEKTGYTLKELADLSIMDQQLLAGSLLVENAQRTKEMQDEFLNRLKELVDFIDIPKELRELTFEALKVMHQNLIKVISLHAHAEGEFSIMNRSETRRENKE